jgi:hypothetical protein
VTTEGIEFINAKPEVVTDYLRKLSTWKIEANPSNLQVKSSGKYLKLRVTGSNGKEYPVRRSFIYKLLRWYSFPVRQVLRLSDESIASICNDYLLSIKREYVTVKFEGEEAVTIRSPEYSEITDLDIIRRISSWGIKTISRNDFLMRITTEERYKFQPVKGDFCGAGLAVINSETGFHSLSVWYYLLRYTCSNGAVARIGEEQDRIHYKRREGELSEFLDTQLKTAEKKAYGAISSMLLLPVRSAEESKQIIKKLRLLTGGAEKFENLTAYDLFNYISSEAKKYDLTKRIMLEKLAGELV